MEFEYYDNTHMKSKETKNCIICGEPTDRLDVLSESHICSDECDKAFNAICEKASAAPEPIVQPIYFITNEAVLFIPEENQFVCIWESCNQSMSEDTDSCIAYDVYDAVSKTLDDGGECDYKSESFKDGTIDEKIPMMIDFIYDSDKQFEIVSRDIEEYKERYTFED